MSIIQIMHQRYSCRSFNTAQVPSRATLEKVLDAARIAPSACNRQPWLFLVVEGDEAREVMSRAYDREWIQSAPAFIIAIGIHDQAWHRKKDNKDHTDVDLSIAIEHICLAATSEGLGTCWVCNFDTDIIQTHYNIPQNMEPIAIIPIGYPSAESAIPEKKRKNLDEIVRWGKLS